MNPLIFVIICFILMFAAITIFIGKIIKADKQEKSKVQNMFDNIKPIRMTVIDIAYQKDAITNKITIIPILKNQNTNKVYISFNEYSHNKFQDKLSVSDNELYFMKIQNENGITLEQKSEVLVYINREIDKVQTINQELAIDGFKYYYGGMIDEQSQINNRKPTLYNKYEKDFLTLINNATYYEGGIELDLSKEM